MTLKIPATVVTGFLGVGKTSLIRHLLEHSGGRRLALLINEFGNLGIDRGIIGGCGIPTCREEDVIELANGCICCTVADEFLPAMTTILACTPAPEHIVIETSGLALPKPLVQAFAWPEVRARVTVDGVLVVVDAAAVLAGRFAADPAAVAEQRAGDPALRHDESPLEELFEDQLLCADLVLVNKTDQVGAGYLARMEAGVRPHLRPSVRLLWSRHGKVDPIVALGLGIGAEDDLQNRPSHHDGGEEHGHDDFESFVITVPPVADPSEIETRLREASRRFDILRIKGFLAVADKPLRQVVQAVGARVERYYDRPWRADEERLGNLVVIGQRGLDPAAIRGMILAEGGT
ncbi:MAG TPA: cobalamin biosynthesis protein CobW [Stellaceae bacterium]|nr:cobalamin biosynthesis protein CobW [Stellaceae bacterium]